MTRVHRAAWVLPITAPPIRDGWVAVDQDRIFDFGAASDLPAAVSDSLPADPASDQARVILPGLVNAHAHLELSWMRGQVPPGASMPAWASQLMALRRSADLDPASAIIAAIAEAHASGTALVGDVANTLGTCRPLAASPLSALVFRELIGFRVEQPDNMIAAAQAELDALSPSSAVHTSLVPHAPYSVSPQLLGALGRHAAGRPFSIHLGESDAELRFLTDGGGPWRDVLESVGAWNPSWRPPECGPVDYLDRLAVLGPRLLAVHGVQLTTRELARLAEAGAAIVTCPRSNEWTGAGSPPIAAFYASGVRVAIGTDSLASVGTLSMFDELAAVRRLAPGVPAGRILRSATLEGAHALGFEDLGSIAPGKRAALIAVNIPAGLDDVEEYLVSGVSPDAVSWLGEPEPLGP